LGKQGFEKAAQGGFSRSLRAVDADDRRMAGRNLLCDARRQRAPVVFGDGAIIRRQVLGRDQGADRVVHATRSRSGSPRAKASTLASAFMPIAMRVSALALPRCGSSTTFSSASKASGTRGSCG